MKKIRAPIKGQKGKVLCITLTPSNYLMLDKIAGDKSLSLTVAELIEQAYIVSEKSLQNPRD